MPTVRNAVAVLLALHTALATAFVLLAPPAPGTGTAGWIIALTVVGASAACTVWVVSARCEVTFNRLLVLSYLGLASTLALEVVSAAFVPYELLFLVWVGCGAVQPAGRAAVFFGVLALAAFAPPLTGAVPAELREAIAWSVLFSAIGFVMAAYVSYVRRQRIELRTGERDARALARAATARVRELQLVTDTTLVNQPEPELFGDVLDRVVELLKVDHGAVFSVNGVGSSSRAPRRAACRRHWRPTATRSPAASRAGSPSVGHRSRSMRSRQPPRSRRGWPRPASALSSVCRCSRAATCSACST
jgi:hypothetical protein